MAQQPKLVSQTTEIPLDDSIAPAQGSPDPKLEGLASYVKDIYTEYQASTYRKDRLKQIDEGRKRYRVDLPPKVFPWEGASNFCAMLEATAVDDLEPRIVAQLVANDADFIQAQPVGEEDAKKAEYVQEIMQWMLRSNMEISRHIKPFAHDLLIDGTRDLIPVWHEETKIARSRQIQLVFSTPDGSQQEPVPPEILQNPQMMEAILQATGLKLDQVDTFDEAESQEFTIRLESPGLHDVFTPDTWDNWADAPYLYYTYPSLYDLQKRTEKNGGPYKNITENLVVDPGRVSDENRDDDAERKGVRHSEHTKQVKVLNGFIKFEDKWYVGAWVPDAAWVEIRRQPLIEVYWADKKPVHRFRLFPESNESMGMGIPKKIQRIAFGVDDMFNQAVDANTITNLPYGIYERSASGGKKPTLRGVKPGDLVEMPKGSNIQFPKFSSNPAAAFEFINLMLAFFQRALSLLDHTQTGQADKGGETYSGLSLIVNEGNIKHSYKGESLRDDFAALLTDIHSILAQNMPLEAKRSIFENSEWGQEKLDVMRIQGQYDIKLTISDAQANKMLKRKEAVERMKLMAGNPIIDLKKTTLDLLGAYELQDADQYIKPEVTMLLQALEQAPQEVMQAVQQALEKKQQEMRVRQIAGEAGANVQRQEIERQVEQPTEGNKLVDQVAESAKRKMITPTIERAVAGDMAAQLTGQGGGGNGGAAL